MKFNEDNYYYIEKTKKITGYIYDIYWKDKDSIEGYISSDTLFNMVKDLICEIDHLDEKIKDLENKEEPDDFDEWHDRQMEEGNI